MAKKPRRLRRLFTRRPKTGGQKHVLTTPDSLRATHFPSAWTRYYGIGGSYSHIYATQYNVRTAIDVIAREAAVLHMHLFESDPRGPLLPDAQIHLDQHPLHTLLGEPAPGMSEYRQWYALFADLCIYDIAYWWKIRQRGQVRALLRIPPQNISIERDPITMQPRLLRAVDGTPIPLRDVVTFWGYDPATSDGNVPPMETLRRLLTEEFAAGQDREGRWRNSSRKDGIIERDVNSEGMSDAQIEAFYLDLEDATAGARGSGRPVMLQPGMKWQDVQWSPKELEYIESRKLSRAEVASFYHMPPAMMAASQAGDEPDRDTLNFFYTSTLPPWLTRVEHEIKAQLLPDFELTPERRRVVYCRFNLDEKLRGSFEERIGILATAAGGPIITVNEARAREGLPPIGGGDLIFVPLNSIRAGGPQASPQNPTDTPAVRLNPAGTTPGGGTVPQASLSDVQAGQAIVLGPSEARAVVSGSETLESVLERVSSKADERQQQEYLAREEARYGERMRQIYEKTFARQRKVKDEFNLERWNRELASDLYDVMLQASEVVGSQLAAMRVQKYDSVLTAPHLHDRAAAVAGAFNEETKSRLDEAGPDEAYLPDRAAEQAAKEAEWLVRWMSGEVAKQNDLELEAASLNGRSNE